VKGAREVYEESENSVQVLLAMAIGYKGHDDGHQLVDFNAEPFVSAPQSRQWKPTTKQLTLELRRRWEKRNREGKKPGTQWRMEKFLSWLYDNPPIEDEDNEKWLMEEVAEFKDDLKESIGEKSKTDESEGGKWIGDIPYLHLIHCLLDDEQIRAAYTRSFDVMTREELDGRNSEVVSRPNVYQMIAEKWNDCGFNPVSDVKPDLHTSLLLSKDLGWSEVQHLAVATAEKVKQKLSEMRAKLAIIIANWETSGQGDGGILKDDDSENGTREFGDISHISLGANDDRGSFLQGNPPYLLYLWDRAYEFNFLSVVIQKIDSGSAAASADDAPVIVGKRKRKESLEGALDSATQSVIVSLKENTTKSRMSFLQQIMFDTKRHMEELQDKIDENNQHRSVPRWLSAVEEDKKQIIMYELELNEFRNK
jgi:hypothetical protein